MNEWNDLDLEILFFNFNIWLYDLITFFNQLFCHQKDNKLKINLLLLEVKPGFF